MTLLAAPLVAGALPALDRALAAQNGPGPVAHFLNTVALAEVFDALERCLPPGEPQASVHLLRAKLKPGRKLTAEYGVVPAQGGPERRIWVTWVGDGATAPGPDPAGEAEARQRGVLTPFLRSWTGSSHGRMSVSVAPVDRALPQLVRLHDRVDLLGLLRGSGAVAGVADVAPQDVTVETVRYRPGQRHVLRMAVDSHGAVFAKIYRDDSGRRVVDASRRVASALGAAESDTGGGLSRAGTYVARERVALWPEVTGTSLSTVLTLDLPGASDAVQAVGSALRLLHDTGSAEGLPACPDAVEQAAETLRTAQIIDALLPAAGSRLRLDVLRALHALSALPREAPTMTHGDFKCENLLVSGSRVHVLDHDRLGRGDPAADIGKFLADLRWWTDGAGPMAARMRDAFLAGYGTAHPARMARARLYDALLQCRMAARRVPIHHVDWEHRVTGAVDVAAATLDEES
jgi:aminoglycoside phosphotransferase (APT) family kinase protein